MTARATVRPPKPESNMPTGLGSPIRPPRLGPRRVAAMASELEYWHNPRCSKSRAGKELLDSSGATYRERRYLDEPPTAAELDRVLTALGMEPWDIARMGEDVSKQ